MKTINRMVFVLLALLIVSNFTTAQETVVIFDALTGSTVGSVRGGSVTSQGYKPGIGWNHILYDVPSQVVNGYIQFEMTGFSDGLIQDPNGGADADNGFFGMYDGRGSSEPIQYFNNFKYNYFRWNFHWRQNIDRVKAVIDCANPESNNLNSTQAWHACGASESCADKREWYSEPTGSGYGFNSGSWYTVRATWNNKNFKVTIDGTTVWETSGPNDYAPIDFKIWLGSAPGYDDKYGNWAPDTKYRNFKVVRYGGSSSSAPVITSSAVTSGTAGQLYSYDVNASGNPTPSYSLTTLPSGMTINSSSGLIQWTPSSIGNYNVTVKAANGVSPDATQSFVINVVQSQQNRAPVITTSPVTFGTVGQLYSYDVNAGGNPVPTYSLTTFPSGMTINSSSGLIQWTPSSTGNFNVTVKAANGVSPDATQSFAINVQANQSGSCPPSMISYWKLNETSGSVYDDYFGTNHARSTNVPAPTAGRVNGAQQFNGTSNKIAAPRIAGYDFSANSSFALEAWIKKPVGSYTGEEIIMERKQVDGAMVINLKFDSQAARFLVRNNASQLFSVMGTKDLYDGNWHHVVGVKDGSLNQLRIYVDGVLENTAAASYTSGFESPDAGITIGWRNIAGDPSYFKGSIDEVAIYNSALDAASIIQHYNNGLQNNGYCGATPPPTSCPPSMLSYWKLNETSGSTYADYIGANNAASTNVPAPTAGRVNGAQQFNGTSNKITAPRIAGYDFTGNSSFTFETWIKHVAGSHSGEEVIVERKSTESALVINLKFNSEAARFLVRNNAGQLFSVTGIKNLYDGNWHHVVGVKDGTLNQLRIYVDGVLENTAAATYTSGFESPDAGISIGWRNVAGDPSYFKGSIDEVAIYNSALNAASITQHYNNGLQNNGYCQVVLAKISLGSVDIFSSVGNSVNGNNVQLNWEIASDLRDGKFEIERSVNSLTGSKDWQKIGEIDLITGSDSKLFVYNDNVSGSGKFSYRIKFAKGGEGIYSEQIETEVLPADYVLYQNYPNPFNPSTKIRFAVPLNTKVTVQIYNQLGEIVAQPVNNFYEAGNYEIEVNMSAFASGVYFYKISAGAFSDVKKMMLTK